MSRAIVLVIIIIMLICPKALVVPISLHCALNCSEFPAVIPSVSDQKMAWQLKLLNRINDIHSG